MKNTITNIINLRRVGNRIHPTCPIKVTFVGGDLGINKAYSVHYLICKIEEGL